VEVGGYRMAWVGYALDDEKRRISPMAFAGEELGYLSEVDISWAEDRPSGEGPAGQAVRTGNPVVFEDVMGNQGFSYWQAPARARGYRSVVCLPLHDGNRSFGVICLYTAQPNPTSAEELKMLGDMAGDLVFGIENCRARLERQRTLEVVIKVAKAVSSGTGTEFFDLLAQNLVESMGAFGGLVGRYNLTDRSIDTLSYVVGGETMENLKYSLEGTPCGQVIGEGIQVYERDVQQAFPEDRFMNATCSRHSRKIIFSWSWELQPTRVSPCCTEMEKWPGSWRCFSPNHWRTRRWSDPPCRFSPPGPPPSWTASRRMRGSANKPLFWTRRRTQSSSAT
jgi:hypothetical protein